MKRAILIVALALASTTGAAQAAERGTEVLWDRYGVPHVFARTEPDLFHGYGWVQAEAHGNLLLKLYAQARGRAAEYFGPSELANDRWMVVNGVPARSADWLARQRPEFRRDLEAFAEGINDYAAAHPEAISPEARRVLPVSAVDVVGHAQRLFQYIYVAPQTLLDRLPGERPARIAELEAGEAEAAERAGGSNGWAVAPKKSANGATMVVMNPHLPWAPNWSTYFEAELSMPGFDLYGGTQVGLPVVRFAFNDRIAFTQTVNSITGSNLYKLTPRDGGYVLDGEVRPFRRRTEVLKIRREDGGLDTETVEVRESVHGPVVAEKDGAPIALRVAGLDRPFALEQYWRMDRARNFTEYEAALRLTQTPAFNIVYGDRDGRIQYLFNGVLPRRRGGDLDVWSALIPGDRSETIWTDFLTYDELPKVTDPATGYVQNSNNTPWASAWPQMLDAAPYAASIPADRVNLRMSRGLRMLSEAGKIGYDQLLAMRFSTRSELADRVLADLVAAARTHGTPLAREAAEVLAAWDRTTQADARGAVLFQAWSDTPGGVNGASSAGWAVAARDDQPLTTPSGLADPARAAAALDAAARKVLADHGRLDVAWGEVMRLQAPGVDLPASGGPHQLGVFDRIDFGALRNGARPATAGSSFSAVVRFDGPRTRAKVLLSYGNSSQPGSPHAVDQYPLLSRQTPREALRGRAAVETQLERREAF